jgi:outer membrane immunogenic protein
VKKLALAATILVFGAASASAADLAARVYTKSPAPIDAAYNWSGFYGGVNVGYGFGRTSLDSTGVVPGLAPFVASDTKPMDGVIGGGQVGWNIQFNQWVVGIEADFQGTGQRLSTTTVNPIFVNLGLAVLTGTQTEIRNERLDWFGTVRGRIGYAVDGLLWYGTGGLAYGHIKFAGTDNFTFAIAGFGPPVPIVFAGGFDASRNKVGWSVGGGVEGAIMRSNWTWKLEYLHMDFGRLDYSFVATLAAAPVAAPVSGSVRLTDDIIRVGLNYRINGPVVAQY